MSSVIIPTMYDLPLRRLSVTLARRELGVLDCALDSLRELRRNKAPFVDHLRHGNSRDAGRSATSLIVAMPAPHCVFSLAFCRVRPRPRIGGHLAGKSKPHKGQELNSISAERPAMHEIHQEPVRVERHGGRDGMI
jgi:hypothetical protein